MKKQKYAFGGDVNASPDQAQPNTYPFPSSTGTTGATTTNNINVGSQPSDLGQNTATTMGLFAKGGMTKGYAKGGKVRGGGCEQRGKTRGRFV